MANQPSKYSKFLVGAASAALVASAVAPVAFAADFKDTKGNTHETAINALSDAGVISGYPDGTFQPNKTLTRSDVVKLLGKWLVAEGATIPTDAVSNPRFTDLKSTSNKELLEYAAVVKDNGVFNGSNGRLLAADNISRENMAVVLVRAFDSVKGIDLVTYVKAQDAKDFKADVKDLSSAKAEAQGAINVLDFFDITNPAVANFNPKGNTTRGHFATFLHKSVETDFSKVTGVANAAVASIKAVNTTTVEVTFKDAIIDINSLKFAVEGLEVSNAVVKQTDAKTVILTTATQEGGKKYEVTLNAKKLGSFEGISAVIPASLKLNTTSLQSKVGNQVILSADIGVKAAGVPVTFNVTPNAALNKAQVEEVYTNAEGIATFSYTQYTNGEDFVAAYPTGAPTKRDFATVYWGVDNILTIEEDKAGSAVANGTKKVYTVTYLDPQTGRPVSNADLNVSFVENVDVDYSAVAKATVTDSRTGFTTTPYQAKNGQKEALSIKTDSKGKATFTVSGTNVAVTPFVFVDKNSAIGKNDGNNVFDKEELKQEASKVAFAGAQLNYTLDITRDGEQEAASGIENGRVYKVKVADPKNENKPYAGGVINVGLDELLDRNMSTNSEAKFTNVPNSTSVTARTGSNNQQVTIKLDSKGEGSFVLYGANNDLGTPVIWIDQNTSVNTQAGVLEDGEPFKVSETTFFQAQRVMGAELNAVNKAGKDAKDFPKADYGTFTFDILNQSGNPIGNYTGKVTLEIVNTGASNLTLTEIDQLVDQDGKDILGTKVIEVGGSLVVVADIVNGKADLRLDAVGATSAAITAHAVTGSNWTVAGVSKTDDRNFNTAVYAETFKATFSGEYIPANFTGTVVAVNKTDKLVTLLFGGSEYTLSYKDAQYYFLTSSVESTPEFFNTELTVGDLVTFTKAADDKSKNKFDIIQNNAAPGSSQNITSAVLAADGTTLTLTFGEAVKAASVIAGDFTVAGGTVASLVPMTGDSKTVVLNVTGTPTTVSAAANTFEYVSGNLNAAITAHAITNVPGAKISPLTITTANKVAVTGTDAVATTTVDTVPVTFTVLTANGAAKYNGLTFKFEQGTILSAAQAGNVVTIKLAPTAANNTKAAIEGVIQALPAFGNYNFANVLVTTAGNFNGTVVGTDAVLANGLDTVGPTAGVYAFTLNSNLVTGDVVTVNGKAYVAGNHFAVGTTPTVTAQKLAAAIKLADARFTTVNDAAGVITLTDANIDGAAAPTLKLN
ncbi:S-layer homology domain-containing protein [Sporosarcina sp. E16_3]|uniref:S-layer homology domain-containing protein n=1 Tax=Sporosarcina sp. E16_3 TaxID=2789293 RepID=UPI001A9351F1|nr:S-layer homology domain-containing protein [Sporosarcina sp. E16_3]MBO0601179.1 S-layer homology domain-containing protein [Sporosarcina sp. E16_3]